MRCPVYFLMSKFHDQRLKFSSQKTLLSVQNRATGELCVFLWHLFVACRPWAWEVPVVSILHQAGVFPFQSLYVCGEGALPWDQEPHKNAGLSLVILSQESFRGLPLFHPRSASLCSLLYQLTMAFHIPSLLCAIAAQRTVRNGVTECLQVACRGLASPGSFWNSGCVRWVQARSFHGGNGGSQCLRRTRIRVSTFHHFYSCFIGQNQFTAKPSFRWWILHLPKRWEHEKWIVADRLSVQSFGFTWYIYQYDINISLICVYMYLQNKNSNMYIYFCFNICIF